MTAEELPDASSFSFDVPEGAKNVIYRYDGFKALGIDAHDEKERKESGIPNKPVASWVQCLHWVRDGTNVG